MNGQTRVLGYVATYFVTRICLKTLYICLYNLLGFNLDFHTLCVVKLLYFQLVFEQNEMWRKYLKIVQN